MKDIERTFLKLLCRFTAWVAEAVTMFVFIAFASYLIYEYTSSFGFWVWLAFVVVTTIAIYAVYEKTGSEWLLHAIQIGAIVLLPATCIGIMSADDQQAKKVVENSDDDYLAIPWKTSEELTELTGVIFPQIEFVDSTGYINDGFRDYSWSSEVKYVFKCKKSEREKFLRILKLNSVDSLSYKKWYKEKKCVPLSMGR